MPRVTKKTKTKELPKTDEIKSNPSVIFVSDEQYLSKLYSEDLVKIKKAFSVEIELNKNKFTITSKNIEDCRKSALVLERLFDWFNSELEISEEDITDLILEYLPKPYSDSKYKRLFTTHNGVEISPRTETQEKFIKTIKSKKISVGYGSSGGGKTLISLVMGLKFLLDGRFDNITICRPLVTVGGKDNIGFLPGDLSEKVFPYNSALHQCLSELLGDKGLEQMIKEQKIIFTPISFLRGSTLNSYIVLDECQNLSKIEILTLMTRLGKFSKLVCTGDSFQQDLRLNTSEKSGLDLIVEKLQDIDRIGFVKFSEKDIQRDPIIGEIIRAFE